MAQFEIDRYFQKLVENDQANAILDLDAILQYRIIGDGGGDWFIIIHNHKCIVRREMSEKPDAILETGVEDFYTIMTGSQEEIGWAFMQGRINMTGSLMPLWRVFTFMRDTPA